MNSAGPAAANSSSVDAITRQIRHPNAQGRPNVNPLWRHSNPDSHYGFRTQASLAGGGSQPGQAGSVSSSYRSRYHLPSSGTTPADLSHYAAIPSGTKWPS